jgi:hypothetical protein
MKTLLKFGLMQATWAWIGIILFLVLGFAKIYQTDKKNSTKTRMEISR